jgi:phosphoenolpyruvate carboxykinase (ATP)
MDLSSYGIRVAQVFRNPCAARLYEDAIHREHALITSSGALLASSGQKTGRSPKDKRIVDSPDSSRDVWWGKVNMPMTPASFAGVRRQAIDFLNSRTTLYVVDGYAGWDPKYRIRVRVICARAYHALFMMNMLIRPTAEELADFGRPHYVILNAGQATAPQNVQGLSSGTCVALNFEQGEMVILGTEYAGEMKKGVFTIMNYLMPKRGVLSMHCSANEGPEDDVSLFFGLSGTGKTTLSAEPNRRLIGDDEHCWSDEGIFNIEGGCYAKIINLSADTEPEIHGAIRYGTVLENAVCHEESRVVDYADGTLTENTRASYPVEYIANAKIPGLGRHPRNVIFLAADAFGVLPPVGRLTPEQAMYHFISGYTAKVAGTEVGVLEPEATFSACFGAAFLVWHPAKYAELLAAKMQRHGTQAWLVNTGWTGGPFGVGHRMPLRYTRTIIDAIHNGQMADAPMVEDPTFGFATPTYVTDVLPGDILVPRNTWENKDAFDRMSARLARLFRENFRQYADRASEAIRNAGPHAPETVTV